MFVEVGLFLQGPTIAVGKYVHAAQWCGLHSFALSFAFPLPDAIVLLCRLETRGRPREKQ
jgi:hypothetical protein